MGHIVPRAGFLEGAGGKYNIDMSLLQLGPVMFGPTAGIISYFRARGLLATSCSCNRWGNMEGLAYIPRFSLFHVQSDVVSKWTKGWEIKQGLMEFAGIVGAAKPQSPFNWIAFLVSLGFHFGSGWLWLFGGPKSTLCLRQHRRQTLQIILHVRYIPVAPWSLLN